MAFDDRGMSGKSLSDWRSNASVSQADDDPILEEFLKLVKKSRRSIFLSSRFPTKPSLWYDKKWLSIEELKGVKDDELDEFLEKYHQK
jgi:hypothetical protein